MKVVDRILGHLHAGANDPAVRALRSQGLPEPRDEHWQHADLNSLARVTNFLANTPTGVNVPELPAPLAGFERILTLNGQLLAPPAVASGAVAAAGDATDPDLRFAQLARAFGPPSLKLQLSGQRRIEWLNVCDVRCGSAYPRLQLQLVAGANVQLVERLLGAVAPEALVCTDLNIHLADGAQLTHTRLHALAAGSVLLDNLSAMLDRRAVYRLDQVSAGQAHARYSQCVELNGDNSELHWSGLAAVSAGESFDALVRVTHRGSKARTTQRFRGICVGLGRVGCDADVRVLASGHGAQVSQNLRALNDGAGTHISLRPRLTIDTDDIQASHGATTGALDENLMFYLLSRGIDAATARSLLKWAFLEDVLATIQPPELRRESEQLAARQLTEVAALELQT
jgi:Fe-S cluster assembly protein SufD